MEHKSVLELAYAFEFGFKHIPKNQYVYPQKTKTLLLNQPDIPFAWIRLCPCCGDIFLCTHLRTHFTMCMVCRKELDL